MNYVDDYGWNSIESACSGGYVTPKILTILEYLKTRRVCDLGSGNGALAAVLHEAGYDVCGVENDLKGVELSRKQHPDINFYHLGVQDNPQSILDEEKQVFDVVVSTEVIEHLYSPHLLPIFARGLLSAGGHLVVSTPYHGYLKNLMLSVFNRWDHHHTALWHGGHIKFWSRTTLTQIIEENGFKAIGFYGAGRLPWLWKSMIIVAQAV